MIKPTVGRVVWFWPNGLPFEGFIVIPSSPPQPCEARIAFVWSDERVNLCVTDHAGKQYAFTSVPLIQPGQPKPDTGSFCTWMPYQVGQAQKIQGET